MSRETKPWLPLYVDDFLGDETVKLAGNRALGCYIKLLCHQWTHRSVPAEPEKLARIVGETDHAWGRIWPELADRFPLYKGRRVNPRLEVERRKADKVLAGRRKGARSANAQRDGQRPLKGRIPGVQTQPQPQTQKDTYPGAFEEAWNCYPRRQGQNSKRAAYRQWQARIAEGVSTETLLAGTKRYAAECQDKLGTQFVKQAATFYGRDRHFEYETDTRVTRDAAVRRAFAAGLRVVDEGRIPLNGFPTPDACEAWIAGELARQEAA